MAIDIRNINEITFTQSFRGYNTEEVDDFLDSLYEEAVAANKTIEELKKRISELETTAGSVESSTENTYAVIANAQEEADRIIDNARLKAHALIESAENRQNEAPVPTQTSVGISFDAAKKLKELFNEMHEKQMAILENVSDNTEESLPKEEIENDIPMVSFAGITNEFTKKIPAERDILGEINAIDFGKLKPQSSPYDTGSPYQEESNETEEQAPEGVEDINEGLAFSFAGSDEVQSEKKQTTFSQNKSEPEDPDDIIAQILRDNNRN